MEDIEEIIPDEIASDDTGREECVAEEIDFAAEISMLGAEVGEVGITENDERYRELRALGLTPKEAYFASASRTYRFDSRAHLKTAVPKAAKSPVGAMSLREIAEARELFPGLSDREIENLYRTVTK